MKTQKIELGFDKDAVWNKVAGRLSVFMDTNCWIDMADETNDTACRVRDKLRDLVASGGVFCPLSWGILEELFKQSGESLQRTASLMEELSLNAIFVMRTELYQWELSRSVRRFRGEPADDSLKGLFVPPAAFVGLGPCLVWNADVPLSPEAQENAQAYVKYNLLKIGVVELAEKMGGSKLDETPPAYSEAAKKVKEKFKGNKKKLFLEEAGNCFYMYITPLLLKYPEQVIASWSAQFGPPDDEEAWFLTALVELPALHNFIDIMVVADSQPERKDKYNHFMDNEIMVAPLAYATVFVSKDKAIRDMLRNRTKILSRIKCQYCDSLDALETWLTEKVA
jgi:hypothetical protein